MQWMSRNSMQKKIDELESKLTEAEDTLQAIRNDKIDAFVINTISGDKVFTLNSADRPYRVFLEQMNEGAITLSPEGVIFFCNKRFSEMIRVPLESILGTNIFDWIVQEDREIFSTFLQSPLENHKEEIRFSRTENDRISLYLSITKLDGDETLPVYCLVATDLTEKKKSEEIIAQERLASSILEQAGEAILVCNENFEIIRANHAAKILAGESVLYKKFDAVFPLRDNDQNPVEVKTIIELRNHKPAELILEKNGIANLLVNIGTIFGNKGEVIAYVINLSNITNHIIAEEKLSLSLKEKTILLKEIHHRVKNNLQIIASLLRLQALYINEDHVTEILNECQNRINSMALIHQQLYESKSFAAIDFSAYLSELVRFLSSTYLIKSDNIILLLPDKKLYFAIDLAVPLGLIINELVTNSFKHAFNGKDDGLVSIEVVLKDKGGIDMSIRDNGCGFPENVDFKKPETLGLQLVNSLTEQISAESALIRGSGSEILINIPPEGISIEN